MAAALTAGVPALIGGLLALLTARSGRRMVALIGFGILLALGFVLYLYFAPAHADCSHCREFLGRSWEPDFAFAVAGLGLAGWAFGAGVGFSLRQILRRR